MPGPGDKTQIDQSTSAILKLETVNIFLTGVSSKVLECPCASVVSKGLSLRCFIGWIALFLGLYLAFWL